MRGALEVVDDPAGVVAERLAAAARAGEQIVLTGGSTPADAYRRAAELHTDWSEAKVWFGDERCVPPDHELSNYRLARETLLDRLGEPAPEVHRMRGEDGPDAGAEDYARQIEAAFGAPAPRFDLLLLGLGSDGHCASLFPGRPEVAERARMVVGVPEAGLEPFVPRISLTLPAINRARAVIFLVAGESKADAVARAFAGPPTPDVPASLVDPEDGTLEVVLDAAAAARL